MLKVLVYSFNCVACHHFVPELATFDFNIGSKGERDDSLTLKRVFKMEIDNRKAESEPFCCL